MLELDLLRSLGWIVIASALCLWVARMIKLPSIVACLMAGIVLGPITGLLSDTQSLQLIAELGIVLLLFLVGLELSLGKIREVGPVAVVAGLGQVVFVAVLGLVFCFFLGFNWMESVFLSVALTFSSTVVVVKVLTDKNEMETLYGRIAVGIFLVQNLVVILILTVLTGLQSASSEVAGLETTALSGVWWGIVSAFGGMLLLSGVVVLASRFLLPAWFGRLGSSPGSLFLSSLGWCLAIVCLAQALSLSLELGAFFAGISLAQLPSSRDMHHRIKPLMNFFVAIFFVTLGWNLSPEAARTEWLPILVLSLFILIGNPVFFMLIIPRMGYGERTSFYTSVTVAQISEFSFIFAGMGVAASLVGERVLVITAVIGVITMALSAYMMLYNRPLYEWLRKRGWLKIFRASGDVPEPVCEADRSNHIIVVGMNSLGRELARRLYQAGERVLALDTDPLKMAGLPCPTLLGSAEYLDVLLEAGLPKAKLLVSALRIEEANELLAFRARQFGVRCSIHAFDTSVMDNLLDLDVVYLMLPKVEGIKFQNRMLQQEGVLPT
ncbi:MAG: cation:proton antiporter [Candidatus Methylacidiphilales bacterium]